MCRVSFTIVSLLFSLSWVTAQDHSDHIAHYHNGTVDEPRSHEQGVEAWSKLSLANADFAFNFYRHLSAMSGPKNILYSPVSISMALSMLSLGARGGTHKNMFTVLGYEDLTQDQVNQAYEHLLYLMIEMEDSGNLDMGIALALRDDFKPLDRFQQDSMHFYASEGFAVDFYDPLQAKAKLNRLIATKTQGKITDVVKSVTAETLMVLISYIFLKEMWEKPFDANMTMKAVFHVDENTTVLMDIMRKTGRFAFYHGNDTTVLTLLSMGQTSMMIILPDEGKMAEVEDKLNKDYVKHWHDSQIMSSVNFAMPKFSISASIDTCTILNKMVNVSHNDLSDFSGISFSETKLLLSKTEHKAVLEVDEAGSAEADSTTIELLPTPHYTMNLNRPFLLLIHELSTQSILFMGKVCDPTAK